MVKAYDVFNAAYYLFWVVCNFVAFQPLRFFGNIRCIAERMCRITL